jgi:hypothetical protein
MLDDFIALSEALTGISPLDRDHAADYLARIQAEPDIGPGLAPLIAAYNNIVAQCGDVEAAITTQIMNDPGLGQTALQIIYLWYISAFFKKDPANPQKGTWKYGPPEQYERALVWPVIKGHAPMTPGTYGYWTIPPA